MQTMNALLLGLLSFGGLGLDVGPVTAPDSPTGRADRPVAAPASSARPQDQAPPASDKPVEGSLVKDEELIRAAPRDTFRVLDTPPMMAAAAAEAAGIVRPDEPVLGVALHGEARAYSLERLGSSELINDQIAKTPIAATW